VIVIVDYDMGNVGSILNMLRKLGAAATVSHDPALLKGADGIILPGVGSFDHGMAGLNERGLSALLAEDIAPSGTPILGICLGMQLLTCASEEGVLPGLALIEGTTRRFQFSPDAGLRVPHMGWACTTPVVGRQSGSLAERLFRGTDPEQRYYFVHAYHVVTTDPADVLATASYGHTFTAAIGRANVIGTQFHPEKSHRYGLHLMRNFVEFCQLRREAVA
jgi:glutamine amidotransferase